MTIHEGHLSPLMKKDGKMKEIMIVCDFCEKTVETAFEMKCDVKTIDICPRCMAILEDEVRKRLREGEE